MSVEKRGGQPGAKNRKRPPVRSPENRLPAWDAESGQLHVLVDTPRGSSVKYKYDGEKGVYKVAHFLPSGMVFPFDFGSIPGTLAEDGDPLDLLVISEAGTFPGCLVPVRLVGAFESRQTQKGRTLRNDRLLGVAADSRAYEPVGKLDEISRHLLDEIERFFVGYNEARGRRFRVTRRLGSAAAKRLVAEGERRFRSKP